MAFRRHSLSTSIAHLHGDERTVGSPLNAAELVALRRTRLFGATGTVLMAIGALVAVQVRDRRAQRMPAEGHPSSVTAALRCPGTPGAPRDVISATADPA
ncbi:hypothetical protein A5671_00075 [Mycolicibacter heraklionensis]|nr:hypothetical protein A5671_00075 [Mycolicibacter heraklionensis]